ncbi:alpha/beta hydrolase [Marinobacter sp. X15-166B]|nr:alpha/beta hydrolase [Marinobacter sp. X15-166B]
MAIWVTLTLAVLLVVTTGFFLASFLFLRSHDHSYLDAGPSRPRSAPPQTGPTPSPAHEDVLATVARLIDSSRGLRGKARLQAMRSALESLSDGKSFTSRRRPVNEQGIRGEWVVAPESRPDHRILYIHGGAWVAGSPKSHRAITDKLARISGASVFVLDYRLMPEHRFMQGIEDCRNAYRWILEQGPDGPTAVTFLAVAGDSAGGSNALGLLAWARDQRLRQADAGIALCPSTDLTLTAPSLRTNLRTDPMLGPALGALAYIPKPVLWWATMLGTRTAPTNPVASPLYGDLAGLPPILVHASEAEMLLDGARRYVAKAQAAGSPVELQTWPHMVHVWHFFTPELPEAEDAYEKIAAFLHTHRKHADAG